MRRREIARKFDEIVAFADVERFIDTPVKHYSSGMQMRLAFAVAAHLEPTDPARRRSARRRRRRVPAALPRQDAGRQPRGPHRAARQPSDRPDPPSLRKRHVARQGAAPPASATPATTIQEYEAATLRREEGLGFGQCFNGWTLTDGTHSLEDTGPPFTIRIDASLAQPVANGHLGISVLDGDDEVVVGWAFEPVALRAGRHVLEVSVPQLPVRPGTYRLSLALFNQGNNLTGGKLVEKWTAVPALLVDAPPVAHPQDEWAGMLNIPATLSSFCGNRLPE